MLCALLLYLAETRTLPAYVARDFEFASIAVPQSWRVTVKNCGVKYQRTAPHQYSRARLAVASKDGMRGPGTNG